MLIQAVDGTWLDTSGVRSVDIENNRMVAIRYHSGSDESVLVECDYPAEERDRLAGLINQANAPRDWTRGFGPTYLAAKESGC